MREAVLETNLPGLELRNRGKVRDIYELGEHLLIVASDRISAFDSVLPTGIPWKGHVLTGLSRFWFEFLAEITPSHYLTCDVDEMPQAVHEHKELLQGRAMLVKRVDMLPVECVVRGYISGSAWADYRKAQVVGGIELPAGLKESDKLETPIFTPATKAESGHDENITFERMQEIIGSQRALELRDVALAIYAKASAYALERGIIIADTKFEFGLGRREELILADEAFTPDSSRFWPMEGYKPGGPQPSFDKQYVRDYLTNVAKWDKEPPAPPLPDDVVAKTTHNYLEAYRLMTGRRLDAEQDV